MIYIRMAVFEAGICPERTIPARMAELAATFEFAIDEPECAGAFSSRGARRPNIGIRFHS
jgi:hypothetical protein